MCIVARSYNKCCQKQGLSAYGIALLSMKLLVMSLAAAATFWWVQVQKFLCTVHSKEAYGATINLMLFTVLSFIAPCAALRH